MYGVSCRSCSTSTATVPVPLLISRLFAMRLTRSSTLLDSKSLLTGLCLVWCSLTVKHHQSLPPSLSLVVSMDQSTTLNRTVTRLVPVWQTITTTLSASRLAWATSSFSLVN